MRRPQDAWSYAYLLGLYLGDGHLADTGWSWQLRIACDAAYPGIVEECRDAMVLSLDAVRPRARRDPSARRIDVVAGSRFWPDLLPQAGPGRKHERPIALEPWQQTIVDAHPGRFVRGLLHSDGCRTVNRFSTTLPSGRRAEYAYVRWFFSNRSDDVRRLFCDACDRLGVGWTLSNARNVSVARRASVAVLDRVAGPKR